MQEGGGQVTSYDEAQDKSFFHSNGLRIDVEVFTDGSFAVSATATKVGTRLNVGHMANDFMEGLNGKVEDR